MLTREHGFNVPGHDAVQHSVKQHETDGCGETVVVFLQGAGKQVTPLYAYTLFLEESEVLAPITKRNGGQEALRNRWEVKKLLKVEVIRGCKNTFTVATLTTTTLAPKPT